MYAVIRIRGSVNVERDIKATLSILRLERVNHCVLVPKTPDYDGMLQKARSYLTWGEVSKDMLERLVAKRGRLPGDRKLGDKGAKEVSGKILKEGLKELKIKPVFRLSPPSKGFRSVRLGYPRGDLGYRGEEINQLLKRMI
jgi:large subunit ribosomal protein L30